MTFFCGEKTINNKNNSERASTKRESEESENWYRERGTIPSCFFGVFCTNQRWTDRFVMFVFMLFWGVMVNTFGEMELSP